MVLGFGLTMPREETKCQGIRTNPNEKVIYLSSLLEGGGLSPSCRISHKSSSHLDRLDDGTYQGFSLGVHGLFHPSPVSLPSLQPEAKSVESGSTPSISSSLLMNQMQLRLLRALSSLQS